MIPASPNATVDYGALNNAGTIVSTAANGGAWIWDPINGIAYLNNLVPVGWSIGNAVSISNSGLILASGSYQNGPFEWLELSPAPTTAGCRFSL